jgi:tetratricopeptide (TPR) repeat protein
LLESLLAADERANLVLDNPAAALGLPAPGTLPAAAFGQYDLLGVLGEGRSGVVYRARQRSLSREVALKALASTLGSGQASRRFATEALALRTLRHPNIVPILDAGTVTEAAGVCRPYIAMELVDGASITEHSRLRDLAVDDRLRLVLQLCAAAACAHRHGVLHRDLSPANILVATDEAGDDHVRVIDFGLARFLDANDKSTLDGHPLGTPGFMSPEQARGDSASIDTRTDIFSIGAVLAALVHQEDVAGQPLPLSDDLSLIIRTAMRDDPDERYQTVDALAADLRALLELRPIAARPHNAAYALSKFVRRHPGRSAGIAFTVAALAIASVAVGVAWSRTAAAERDAADAGRLLLHEVAALLHNRIGGFSEERRMLESLLPRLEPFAARYRDDPDIQNDLALLLGRLGDSYSQRFDHASALQYWERALECRRAVAALPEAGPDAAANLSIAVVRVGDESGQLGDPSRRFHQYLEAMQIDEASAARWPDHAGLASNLASSHERLGDIHRREGRLEEALRSSDRQLDAARRVGELEGDTRRATWDLAAAHGTRGIVLSDMLRRDLAAAERDEAVRCYIRLAERFPGDRDVTIRLASALGSTLNLLDFGTQPGASARLDVARSAIDAIIKNDPGYRQFIDVRVVVTCAQAHLRLVAVDAVHDFPEIDEILGELEAMVAREGKVDDAGTALEMLTAGKASLLMATGRRDQAVETLRRGVALARRWDPSTGDDGSDWRFALELSLAGHELPACGHPVLERLIAMDVARLRRLDRRLDLLDLLRTCGCVDQAERLAAALRQTIPVEWTEARRRIDGLIKPANPREDSPRPAPTTQAR